MSIIKRVSRLLPKGLKPRPVKTAAWQLTIEEQADFLHRALFGWPMDHLTPKAELIDSPDARTIARKILHSERFRDHNRLEIPLWPTDKWVCTDFHDLRVWLNLRDSHVSYSVLQGEYEEPEIKFVLSHLEEGGGFVDIGANIGLYSLQAARALGPRGAVYSFEPRPDTFRMLKRSAEENGFADRVRLFNVGLSDKTGKAFIHLDEFVNHGASFVREGYVDSHDHEIDLLRLDDIPIDRPIKIVKMDVEGFEERVIAGGTKFLERHRPIVLSELFPDLLRRVGGTTTHSYVSKWYDLGFEMRRLEADGPGDLIRPDDVRDDSKLPLLMNVVSLPR